MKKILIIIIIILIVLICGTLSYKKFYEINTNIDEEIQKDMDELDKEIAIMNQEFEDTFGNNADKK